jgi:hypothetical protein
MDIKKSIISQYNASLEMLRQAIEKCPESLWLDEGYMNRFWHISYHTLFYTHLYLQNTEKDFIPWQKHKDLYQHMGRIPWPRSDKPIADEPYSKQDVLEYIEFCKKEVTENVAALNLEAESGFEWIKLDKFELQLYNIRHIQHHAGQLIERLRAKENIGVGWVGKK